MDFDYTEEQRLLRDSIDRLLADRYAFENIASVAPFITSMNKLAEQNLAERTPSRWVEWWFHSHPAIARRVAAAESWEKQIAGAGTT